jgi:hypothetical protein
VGLQPVNAVIDIGKKVPALLLGEWIGDEASEASPGFIHERILPLNNAVTFSQERQAYLTTGSLPNAV